jgi:hypothetical protein
MTYDTLLRGSLLTRLILRTLDPELAHFFYVHIPCTYFRKLKEDHKEGLIVAEEHAAEIERHIRILPYFNRSLGIDHFYVCTHDMGGSVLNKTSAMFRKNVIGVVNTADVDSPFFVPYRDISLPPSAGSSCPTCLQKIRSPASPHLHADRSTLAFFAGNFEHGSVRPRLREALANKSDIVMVDGKVAPMQYLKNLTNSYFCLCPAGNRGWSPRLSEAFWYGCIPVIIADHYDLPLSSIVPWELLSVRVRSSEIPKLHQTLTELVKEHPARVKQMREVLWKYRQQFIWESPSEPFDAFHSVLLELWKRRRFRG